jgi:hypothetical protein
MPNALSYKAQVIGHQDSKEDKSHSPYKRQAYKQKNQKKERKKKLAMQHYFGQANECLVQKKP